MPTECEGFHGVPGSKDFFNSVHTIRDSVIEEVESTFDSLRQDFQALRHLCTHDEDSYVIESMLKVYNDCKLVTNSNPELNVAAGGRRRFKKSTAGPARIQLIREKLVGSAGRGQQSIFESVRDKVLRDFNQKVTRWGQKECLPELKNGCNSVVQEFERRFAVEQEEIKQEGDKEAIAALKQAAESALCAIDGDLKMHIEKFEEYEKQGKL